MGRRVETGRLVPASTGPSVPSRDDFLARLVKYIPAEIVGLYLALAKFVPEESAGVPHVALWYVFAGCAFLTPIYLWRVTNEPAQGKGPLKVQIVLGTLAFPVWVFAVGGPFDRLSWYGSNDWTAGIALVLVTFAFGLVEPKPGS